MDLSGRASWSLLPKPRTLDFELSHGCMTSNWIFETCEAEADSTLPRFLGQNQPWTLRLHLEQIWVKSFSAIIRSTCGYVQGPSKDIPGLSETSGM